MRESEGKERQDAEKRRRERGGGNRPKTERVDGVQNGREVGMREKGGRHGCGEIAEVHGKYGRCAR